MLIKLGNDVIRKLKLFLKTEFLSSYFYHRILFNKKAKKIVVFFDFHPEIFKNDKKKLVFFHTLHTKIFLANKLVLELPWQYNRKLKVDHYHHHRLHHRQFHRK